MLLDFNYKDLDVISKTNNKITLDWGQLWANRGHTLGSGLISPDRKYFYLSIPKNSSSFIKTCLLSLEWEHASINEYAGAKPIVALRDPESRWISGIIEYLFMYHAGTLDNICDPFNFGAWPVLGEKLGLSLLFDKITFDDHTDRQCMFLQDVTLDDCIWVYIDQNFSTTFSQLLTDIGYPNDFNDYLHEVDSDPNTISHRKKLFKQFFKWVIDNDSFKKYNINQWFWCDQELIDTVEFYGR